jgi:hypothetical protein
MRHVDSRGATGRRVAVVGALVLLIGSGLVLRSSMAAFTATTSNPSDQWATGTVTISDDDSGTARFSETGMVPGDAIASGTKCIKVSYTGSVTADIRMYVVPADLTDTGLGQYLTFTVEEGSGGTFASCAGFTPSATVYGPGTLADFAATYQSFATGFSTWQASGADNRTYQISYALQDNNSAQGKSVSLAFTWEADSV